MTAERLTVRAPDGRELDVMRHGPADGRALVFHVGTPSAPDELPLLTDALEDDRLVGRRAHGVRHALSRGTAGWFDDDLAFVTPWGFDLSEITVPVSIWHGDHDHMVPISHGRWLAEHVAGARVHLYDDEGHISLVRQLPRIFEDLVSRAGG